VPDILALYGAVAGSAGLLSLGWQAYTRRFEHQDRIIFNAFHVGRRVWPDDPGYEAALKESQERRPEFLREKLSDFAEEYGTAITITNLSTHPLFIRGGGMAQDDAHPGICATGLGEPEELRPRTTFREFWIDDSWAEKEEGMDLRHKPIRAFVDLDDGKTHYSEPIYLFPTLRKR
jgi:hypothetical protein